MAKERRKMLNHLKKLSFVGITAIACFLVGCRASSESTVRAEVKPRPEPEYLVSAPAGLVPTATEMPSTNKHDARGVSCEQCHGTTAPTSAPLSNKACIECHKQADLVKATAKYDDVKHKSQNPHESHLHGASCFVCHKNHSNSVLYCDECHQPKFGWNVP
jgi:hypothetical protein